MTGLCDAAQHEAELLLPPWCVIFLLDHTIIIIIIM